ncbi:MAG TPA: Dam family site-specific DNA-(adenine-N6)-methyltransferase, partial [Vicinamibacterales bacterium]|nr:Dam family site-specific DNA-(adenine-N6)-methyltransferase [Vicinamibacterales bacterium]
MLPKPFTKRCGGKRQLLPEILPRIPKRFRAYREPFVGGGALFWKLYRDGRIDRAYLSDACPHLIGAYLTVRDEVEDLIRELATFRNEEQEFYRHRARFKHANRRTQQLGLLALNEPTGFLHALERTALYLYLGKTCFNGLSRFNADGEFNASFAGYEDPTVCDAENLRACHVGLRGVDIQCRDFAVAFAEAEEDDFLYADPPYVPLTATSSFVGYCADGFHVADHVRLRDAAASAKRRGVHVLLSNSSAPTVFDLYQG